MQELIDPAPGIEYSIDMKPKYFKMVYIHNDNKEILIKVVGTKYYWYNIDTYEDMYQGWVPYLSFDKDLKFVDLIEISEEEVFAELL